MAEKGERPIIIVKRRKKGGGGHHGGAWKVAYADFVTAMMAFFLVMWLVTAVSEEERAAIFDYFNNPSMEDGKSPKPAPGQQGPGGASTSPINMRGGLDSPRTANMKITDLGAPLSPATPATVPPPTPNVDEAKRIAEEAERKNLESLLNELKEAISKSQALAPFKDQLLLDITPEGLRIQIVDEQNRPMFDLGGSRLKDYTTSILRELAPYLASVNNRISLSGHTDKKAYAGRSNYSNWELSADRANAARRTLESGGLPPEKIARVVGLSSSVLFDRENPTNPINRRISIIVMTKQAEESALKTDAPIPKEAPQDAAAADGATTPPSGEEGADAGASAAIGPAAAASVPHAEGSAATGAAH